MRLGQSTRAADGQLPTVERTDGQNATVFAHGYLKELILDLVVAPNTLITEMDTARATGLSRRVCRPVRIESRSAGPAGWPYGGIGPRCPALTEPPGSLSLAPSKHCWRHRATRHCRYTFGMTVTTIKVSKETRDRLKAQAGAAHLSLGEHLTRLADSADKAARLAALSRAIAETPVDLAAGYAAEAAVWEAAELNDARGA